jgi:hypothetical protein
MAAESSAIDRGVAWLLAAQEKDGGWHSETYGAMRGGAAITALVLYCAAHLPEKSRANALPQLRQGFGFLLPGLAKQGCIACPDGSLDFPVYATPLMLAAARRLPLGASDAQQRKLVSYVVESQLAEARGFAPGDRHFGGWDLMGTSPVVGRTSDTNVSLAVYALEALAELKDAAVRKTQDRALQWLAGCQNLTGDGGFAFSPDPKSLNNKAEWSDKENTKPRSYGSATCDGLRSLVYAGLGATDKRVVAAVKWLVDRPGLAAVPGFEDLPEENGWQEGLIYYYYASLAQVLLLFPERQAKERRAALAAALRSQQHDDGRWQNPSSRMREDDPLIATCLAIIALCDLARPS